MLLFAGLFCACVSEKCWIIHYLSMVGQSYVASFTMIFVALLMVVLSVQTCRGQDEGESILMYPVNEYQ